MSACDFPVNSADVMDDEEPVCCHPCEFPGCPIYDAWEHEEYPALCEVLTGEVIPGAEQRYCLGHQNTLIRFMDNMLQALHWAAFAAGAREAA